jgi:hypothetical protein
VKYLGLRTAERGEYFLVGLSNLPSAKPDLLKSRAAARSISTSQLGAALGNIKRPLAAFQ